MDAFIGLLSLVAIIGAFWGVIQLFRKGRHERGLIYIAGAVSAFVVVGFAVGIKNERDAQSAGYVNAKDQELAAELGYTSAEDWTADRERILEERAQQRETEARAAAEEYQRRQAQAEQERLEAEAAERARLEAERLAEETAAQSSEDQRRAEMAAKTSAMTESIAATVQSHYGVEVQPLIPDRALCREDGYCDFNTGVFRIQVYGAGLAVVEPTNQASMTDYIEMCSVVFAAISGSEINYAGEVVGLIYGAALNAGSAERDVNGIEVKVSPAASGALGCRLFKY